MIIVWPSNGPMRGLLRPVPRHKTCVKKRWYSGVCHARRVNGTTGRWLTSYLARGGVRHRGALGLRQSCQMSAAPPRVAPRQECAGGGASLRTFGQPDMHPDGPNGDRWRRPFTAHLPPQTLLARSETTGHPTDCAPSFSVRAQRECRSLWFPGSRVRATPGSRGCRCR